MTLSDAGGDCFVALLLAMTLRAAGGDCFVALLLAMTLSDAGGDCFVALLLAMTLRAAGRDCFPPPPRLRRIGVALLPAMTPCGFWRLLSAFIEQN